MIKKVIQQGRSDFDARSVLPVREHDKMATCLREALRRRQGTLLVAFFNIPTVENAPAGNKNAGRGKHASTNQPRVRDVSIFQIADPKPWTWLSDRYEKVLV
jgi:hypothetical protein